MIFINQFHIALIHPLPLILPLNVILHTILTLRNRFYCLTIVMGLTYPQNMTYLSKIFSENIIAFLYSPIISLDTRSAAFTVPHRISMFRSSPPR